MPDDFDAWKREAATIKPLRGKQPPIADDAAPPKKSSPTPAKMHAASSTPLITISTKTLPPLSIGNVSGIDIATIRKLKRGQLAIQATLDLHGMKQTEALDALESFIHHQFERRRKCCLLITGKGSLSHPSILKTNLPLWLNMPNIRPYIIYADQANQQHGGSGAFYVLLRKKPL